MRQFVLITAVALVLASTPGVSAETSCAFVTQRIQCGTKSCNKTSHECVPCEVDSDCYEHSMGCTDGKCVLKPLAKAFDGLTIVAPLVAFLVCAIAVVAGIGGGGILVPLYFAVLDVPLLNAVALSQATIAGQSFFNVILLLPRRHPKFKEPEATRPVINYEYLCLMLPISLVGTMLGNLLSQISPNWLRVAMLYLLLGYILFRVIKRLIKQRKEDKERQALLKEKSEREKSAKSLKTLQNLEAGKYGSVQGTDEEAKVEDKGELLPQYPKQWYVFIFVVFSLLFTTNLIRGPVLGIIECGSGYFWGMIAGVVAYNLGLFGLCYNHLTKRHEKELDGDLPEGNVPFKWNRMTTIVFPLVSVFAGAAASMLGIGGGLVLSFLLYEAGMVPEEASATSGVATFLVATSSAAQFLLQGQLRWDYGLMVFGAGVCSTFIGQFVFNKQIRKHGWNFLILGSLAFVIIGSMASLTAVGIYNTYETVANHGSLGFGQLCKHHTHTFPGAHPNPHSS